MRVSTISGRIAEAAARAAGSLEVEQAVIGLGFTMVGLEDGRCGLAYTLRDEIAGGCDAFPEAGTLAGRELAELAGWMEKTHPLASALGLAAANAVLEPPPSCLENELFDILGLEPGENVATVGRFRPLEPVLKKLGVELRVIERGESLDPLRHCDVALITATSIINHTVDELLSVEGRARETVILGPSTPYLPEAFLSTGVTLLAGSAVRDPERAWTVVSQGGGTMILGKTLEKWVARVPV